MQSSPAVPATVLVLYTVIAACVAAAIFDLQWLHIIPFYVGGSVFAILSGFLVCSGIRFVSRIRLDREVPFRHRKVPLRYLLGDMTWESVCLLMIGVPVFFSAYTTIKSALPFFADYVWDDWLAQLEHFGRPSWQWLHAIAPPADWMAEVYAIAWTLAMLVFLGIACCRSNYRVFSAFFLTWTLGGLFLAALFASKGPMQEVPTPDRAYLEQVYLLASMGSHYVQKGGGVSAMPSMHLATCALISIYTRRTWLYWPSVLFFLFMWFLSVHLGFHYASDGIAGAGVAAFCWKLAPYLNARVLFPAHYVFAWRRARLAAVPIRK